MEAQDVDRSALLSAYAVGDAQLPNAELHQTGAQEYACPEDFAFVAKAQQLVDTPGPRARTSTPCGRTLAIRRGISLMAAQENRSVGAMIRLLPLLLVAGRQTMPEVNCANAAKARAAAELALKALDRVYPISPSVAQN